MERRHATGRSGLRGFVRTKDLRRYEGREVDRITVRRQPVGIVTGHRTDQVEVLLMEVLDEVAAGDVADAFRELEQSKAGRTLIAWAMGAPVVPGLPADPLPLYPQVWRAVSQVEDEDRRGVIVRYLVALETRCRNADAWEAMVLGILREYADYLRTLPDAGMRLRRVEAALTPGLGEVLAEATESMDDEIRYLRRENERLRTEVRTLRMRLG